MGGGTTPVLGSTIYNNAGKFVLLVAGGSSQDINGLSYPTASTETLEVGSTTWIENSPLPQKNDGLRAVTVDNKIFALGKRRHSHTWKNRKYFYSFELKYF